MPPFILNLRFVAAPANWQQADPDFAESALQACKDVYAAGAWRVANVKTAQAFVPRETSASPGSQDSPGFMVDALEVAAAVNGSVPVVAALLGAWLQACPGRKIRLRVGGVDTEAGNTRDVERLLDRARGLCADAAKP